MGHPSDVAAPLFAMSQAAQLDVPFLPLFQEEKKVKGKAVGCCVTPPVGACHQRGAAKTCGTMRLGGRPCFSSQCC